MTRLSELEVPSSIKCIELIKAILQLAGQNHSGLGEFLRRSLANPRSVCSSSTAADVWPCPPPRWRWTAAAKPSPRKRRRRRFLEAKAKVLQVVVCTLNWLSLGYPKSPPKEARLGAPISKQQHEMLERLESLVGYFLSAPDVDLSDLGRAGDKMAKLFMAAIQLPFSSVDAEWDELASFLDILHKDFDPYGKRKDPDDSPGSEQTEFHRECATEPTKLGPPVPVSISPAKPVVADRIKWKLRPSFNPEPYLVDPVVREAFVNPEIMRRPANSWPVKRKAKVHCSKDELLKLAKKWDAHQACRLVATDAVREEEAVGLFAVGKDLEYDRLIINPTVINSRMYGCNSYTKTLAPGHLIGLIRLLPEEHLVISSDDLSEYYYTFQVSFARACRNAIGVKFEGRDFLDYACYDPALHNSPVYLCLSTLAMGDSLAVEIAQQAHYNLLKMLGGAMLESEVLQYRKPVPRGPFYELLTIDDHIGLQKISSSPSWSSEKAQRDQTVFKQANKVYEAVGLVAHPGKMQRRVTQATVLGAEVDGTAGRCSAPRSRIALLMFLTLVIATKGSVTRKILQSILGCWIHVCLFRRPVFAVLEAVFHEGLNLPSDQPFILSRMAINELLTLALLGPLIQTDMRASVAPYAYMMDASPYGGAICRAHLGESAVEEIWRHTEQRGYYTALQQGAGSVLREKGLEHEEIFGPEEFPKYEAVVSPVTLLHEPEVELPSFDCIELFAGYGNWSKAHANAGLKVHPGIEISSRGIGFGDLLDNSTFRQCAFLANSGKVKEWRAGPPCWSYGTLRRPRLRSKDYPAGFNPDDKVTKEQTLLAVRTAFILTLALLRGSFISVEQPGSSVMFHLHCFQILLTLGCVITRFPFCKFGSGFNKPSKWLHNKPWLQSLESTCACAFKGCHFVIEGSFTAASRRVFNERCQPDAASVYGRVPRRGEAVSAYSAMYPVPLCEFMARGSVEHRSGDSGQQMQPSKTFSAGSDRRSWHEDPDWVHELCDSVQYKELFRYRFKKTGHINTLECRVYKSWLKHSAKTHPCSRLLGLLDSRVTMGAAAKGRSSSRALSRILRSSLGYVLGGALYPGTLHCRSAWNCADGPSRDSDVPAPVREEPMWLRDLRRGRFERFEKTIQSSFWRNPLGRWVRLLLLLCGDVEPNPGPVKSYEPRGELNMAVGFSKATVQRMERCLAAFADWLVSEAQTTLCAVLEDVQLTDLALRAYGRALFSSGKPRYWLVYAITAVQHQRPQYRNFLAGAWQVDKKWQVEEPGQCRAVLSAPLVRAIVAVSLLWGWNTFAAVVSLGFSGMLHPSEFVHLIRSDLIFPEDTLDAGRLALYVHIQNPKTARFARRQHVKIADDSVVLLCKLVFKHFNLQRRLFAGSMAVFRRQWNAVLDHLEVPRRQLGRGATPGTLRGSGATHYYLADEDLSKIAWRGRWAKLKTLEFYIQEVGAQLFLQQLAPNAKQKIALFSEHVDLIVAASFPTYFRSNS